MSLFGGDPSYQTGSVAVEAEPDFCTVTEVLGYSLDLQLEIGLMTRVLSWN